MKKIDEATVGRRPSERGTPDSHQCVCGWSGIVVKGRLPCGGQIDHAQEVSSACVEVTFK